MSVGADTSVGKHIFMAMPLVCARAQHSKLLRRTYIIVSVRFTALFDVVLMYDTGIIVSVRFTALFDVVLTYDTGGYAVLHSLCSAHSITPQNWFLLDDTTEPVAV